MPIISVLLPVYNAEKFLEECLEAILSQTFVDFELIICDDCSKDSSLNIITQYAQRDHRVRLVANEQNIGIARTRNKLIASAEKNSRYFALIDADDVCHRERFAKQFKFLENNKNIGGVGSCLEIIDEESNITGTRDYPTNAKDIRKILPLKNVLAQPAMMVRRELVETTGDYNLNLKVCSDYDYWLRALINFDFANLPDYLLRYRMSSTQCKQSKLKLSLSNTLRIQREYMKAIKRYALSGILHQVAGFSLLLLPNQFILWLFQIMTYKKKRSWH